MKSMSTAGLADDIVRLIYDGTAAETGDAFFSALVRATALAMRVRWAFVSEFAGSRQRVRTIAFWAGDDFGDNFEYDLDGTVCQDVLQGNLGYYASDVASQFPGEPALAEMGVESYLATPMTTPEGEVLGHLAVFDVRPMCYDGRELEVFKVFGARAAAELARKRTQAALETSERRLASILRTATDAIITIDAQHRIVLFNAAAGQIFRCSPHWAVGQPFDRFLSRQFRQIVRRYVDDAKKRGEQAWAPEGVTAVRADGEEFPIEVTLSPLEEDGNVLYTLILRDITRRTQAQQEVELLQQENISLREEHRRSQGFEEMIGDSPAIGAVYDQIRVVAPTDTGVLLVGETGTGKEMIARALHERSGRKDKLFICVNCAALPAELVESELFGHEKGAFTGATGQRKGRFELADGGTLFLDEVGELTAHAQAKLLRVLQERTFERVGGTHTLRVDVRLVAATNRDLAAMVGEGTFRADLYYRLNVFPIWIPPLRDRSGDVPLLAYYFLERMARKLGRDLRQIDQHSLDLLAGYSWPGNVRELQNVIERAAILTTGTTVRVSDMVLSCPPQLAPAASDDTSLNNVQRTHIIEVLDKCHCRIEGPGGAAAALGMKPSTLRYRMQKLGIEKQPPHS
jgi:PAS domain S-box-containing protein